MFIAGNDDIIQTVTLPVLASKVRAISEDKVVLESRVAGSPNLSTVHFYEIGDDGVWGLNPSGQIDDVLTLVFTALQYREVLYSPRSEVLVILEASIVSEYDYHYCDTRLASGPGSCTQG